MFHQIIGLENVVNSLDTFPPMVGWLEARSSWVFTQKNNFPFIVISLNFKTSNNIISKKFKFSKYYSITMEPEKVPWYGCILEPKIKVLCIFLSNFFPFLPSFLLVKVFLVIEFMRLYIIHQSIHPSIHWVSY